MPLRAWATALNGGQIGSSTPGMRTRHSRTGPNHFKMDGGGAVCRLCGAKNPLGNLQRMSLREGKRTLSAY
jgi:hypothetical protein